MARNEIMLMWGKGYPNQPIDWLIWSRAGARQLDSGRLQSGSELTSLRNLALLYPCYLLLPQEQILSTSVSLPVNSRAARRAIPFQLEEQLCEDPDQLHFAQDSSPREGHYAVQVVSRSLIQGWHELISSTNMPIKGVFADAQSLEGKAKQWSKLELEDRVLLKFDQCQGVALTRDGLHQLVPMLERAAPIQTLDVNQDESPLASMARYLNLEQAINLMQGDYKLRDPVRELISHWRIPALLMMLLVLISFAQLAVDNYRLSREKESFDQQVEALYRETFPDAQRIVNPRVQMERRLEQLRRKQMGSPLLQVLDTSVPAFQQYQDVRMDMLHYDAEGRRIALEVKSDNAGSIQQLNERLNVEGVNSQLGQFSSSAKTTKGRITVTEVR
ncbi:type II secretion system protein GspL [Marinobacterium stanieri]|nr:type II secretion system protein GspL [Marinobacterium stanieri]